MHRPHRRRALTVAAAALTVAATATAAPALTADDAGLGRGAATRIALQSEGVRVDRLVKIAATFPAEVEPDSTITATGVAFLRASGSPARRPVVLKERLGDRWATLVRKNTTRTGRFKFRLVSGQAEGVRAFRVVAPAYKGLTKAVTPRHEVSVRAAVTATPTPSDSPTPTPSGSPTATPLPSPSVSPTPTPTASPTVSPTPTPTASPTPSATPTPTVEPTPTPTPTPTPAGDPFDWSYLHPDGTRWNPCQPLTWAYNPTGEYAGALADVTTAFARIAAQTGLVFQYVGTTDHVEGTGTTPPANALFSVAWADAGQVGDLAGGVVGFGGGEFTSAAPGSDVTYRFVRGYLVLDKGDLGLLRQGYDVVGSPTWGQVMVHEVLHALGLGHAAGSQQVMYPSVSGLNHLFGAGDLTGMVKIGATQGCLF